MARNKLVKSKEEPEKSFETHNRSAHKVTESSLLVLDVLKEGDQEHVRELVLGIPNLLPPSRLDLGFTFSLVQLDVGRHGRLGDRKHLVPRGFTEHLVEIAGSLVVATADHVDEFSAVRNDVFEPRVLDSVVVDGHADRVDIVVARVVRHVRIILAVESFGSIGVHFRLPGFALAAVLAATAEGVSLDRVDGPHHVGLLGYGVGLDGVPDGHPHHLEVRWVLAVGEPGTVHFGSKADDHFAAGFDDGAAKVDELLDGGVRDHVPAFEGVDSEVECRAVPQQTQDKKSNCGLETRNSNLLGTGGNDTLEERQRVGQQCRGDFDVVVEDRRVGLHTCGVDARSVC